MEKQNLALGLLFLLFVPFTIFAQFSDDFTEPYTLADHWQGDKIDSFLVSNNELKVFHEPNTVDVSMSRPSKSLYNATWEFTVRFATSPSSSNRVKIYLASDKSNLENPLNGYYVMLGNTSDEVSLYSQTESSSSKIIDGTDGILGNENDNKPILVRVTRDNNGNWELLRKVEGVDLDFVSEGTVQDTDHFQSFFFGIVCEHTSTKSQDNFFFDDFNVTGDSYDEDIPPIIEEVKIIGLDQKEVEVKFNEIIKPETLDILTNYSIDNNIGSPISIQVINEQTVHLVYNNAFQEGTIYTLTAINIQDMYDNTIQENTAIFGIGVSPSYNELIITEVMVDVNPIPAELPEAKYVEVLNTTNKIIDLNGIQFSDLTTSVNFGDYVLLPGQYAILCSSSDENVLSIYGKTIPLSPWPEPNSGGDFLSLYNTNTNQYIFSLEYDASWYHSIEKESGGWSLEMINPAIPCLGEENWMASIDEKGGTPAAINSVNDPNKADLTAPRLQYVIPVDLNLIKLIFNEKLDVNNALNATYVINGSQDGVIGKQVIEPQNNEVLLDLSFSLEENKIYEIKVDNLTDCAENIISNEYNTKLFGLPQLAEEFDVLINEVLVDPEVGGVDFIEIYNQSEKFINLKNWKLANPDKGEYKTITEKDYPIAPASFLVLTTNPDILKGQYINGKEETFFSTNIPAFNADKGSVALVSDMLDTLDFFEYSEDFHFELLDETKGVSLERISLESKTNDPNNWHSAAAPDYATPGYMNSQFKQEGVINGSITIDPKVFIPNNNGDRDYTTINYKFDEPGYVANRIKIVDAHGREVKMLAQNELLSTSGFFRWDGIDEKGQKVRVGYYLVVFEIFNLNGQVSILKETVAVGNTF